MMELTDRQWRRRGALLLMGIQTEGVEEFPTRYQKRTLRNHPANLRLPEGYTENHLDFEGYLFQSWGYGSREDALLFAHELAKHLTRTNPNEPFPYLRKIKAQYEIRTDKYDWYYEAGLGDRVLFSGHWPDYCSQYGKSLMDSIFAFVSELYAVNTKVVTLEYQAAERLRARMCSIRGY